MLQSVRSIFTSEDDATIGSPPDVEVSLEDAYTALSNRRRRDVIEHLTHSCEGGAASVRELAEHIAAIENNERIQDLNRTAYNRVRIALHQAHLPVLDDAGVIDYNQPRCRVEATAETLVLADVMAAVARHLNGGDQNGV